MNWHSKAFSCIPPQQSFEIKNNQGSIWKKTKTIFPHIFVETVSANEIIAFFKQDFNKKYEKYLEYKFV